ncbi:late embryogenesis abundant protein Lea5-D-like isoform 2 [Panicum miliaceum]|uniref:Late embryogenesis abundant protein Lea5-D-like isoform 2 n=1 Tax=Panicum miliaceum TaxID=4540 RepID=A0A3L6SJ37_PANMI|nr:late embryogenesis abundant protein Lea5-D-like isoform 2 [Panicum miliaceum]
MERVASSCARFLSQRKGYSVAAVVVKGPGRMVVEKVAKRVMGKEVKNTAAAAPAEKTPWVPDPATGYYRPAGGAKEVDAVDLRAMLLLPQRVAN